MSASLFDQIADGLEHATSLSRLEARGTLRLTAQKLGLDPKDLARKDLGMLLESALPRELATRGIPEARELCDKILRDLDPGGSTASSGTAGAPSLFDWVAGALERQTKLSRLAARGTLRHILKDAGLPPERTTRKQMEVVLTALAPKHLKAAAVADAEAICARVLEELRSAAIDEASGPESPEDVFDRLGRR